MKREFLKELGLTDEQIDKVMAENGSDIEAQKQKTTKAETERDGYKKTLDETQAELKKFDGLDVDAQKKSIEELQTKYDTDTKALQEQIDQKDYNYGVERYINSNYEFSSDRIKMSVLEDLKKQNFKFDGDKLLGADDWMKNLKEKEPASFKPETNPDDKNNQNPPPNWGNPPTDTNPPASPDSLHSALHSKFDKK